MRQEHVPHHASAPDGAAARSTTSPPPTAPLAAEHRLTALPVQRMTPAAIGAAIGDLAAAPAESDGVRQCMRNGDISGAIHDAGKTMQRALWQLIAAERELLKSTFGPVEMSKADLTKLLMTYDGTTPFATFIAGIVPTLPLVGAVAPAAASSSVPVRSKADIAIDAIDAHIAAGGEAYGLDLAKLRQHFTGPIVGRKPREELMAALGKIAASAPAVAASAQELLADIKETHFSESHALQDAAGIDGWKTYSTK